MLSSFFECCTLLFEVMVIKLTPSLFHSTCFFQVVRQKVYAGIGARLHSVDTSFQDVPGFRPGFVTVCQGPVHHVDGDVVEAVLEASRGLPAHGAAALLLLQAFAFPEGHVLHRGRVVPFGVVCKGGGHGGHSGGGGESFRTVPPAPLGVGPDDLGPAVGVRGRAGKNESLHPREGEPLHPSRGAGDPGTFWLLNDGLGRGGGHAKGHLGVIPAVGRAGQTSQCSCSQRGGSASAPCPSPGRRLGCRRAARGANRRRHPRSRCLCIPRGSWAREAGGARSCWAASSARSPERGGWAGPPAGTAGSGSSRSGCAAGAKAPCGWRGRRCRPGRDPCRTPPPPGSSSPGSS